MYIANNFNDFVEKITEAERTALNTLAGREITQQLLEMKLEENPHLTPEEWQQTSSSRSKEMKSRNLPTLAQIGN